jgi:hypothetical protein
MIQNQYDIPGDTQSKKYNPLHRLQTRKIKGLTTRCNVKKKIYDVVQEILHDILLVPTTHQLT